MKPLRERPKDTLEVDLKPNVVHFVLTGWRKQYNVRHPNYFKIPYSSHSSFKEIQCFVRVLRPKNLIFNMTIFLNNDAAIQCMSSLVSLTENGKEIVQEK